eukprot:TRINITY_DN1421_c0_g1_i1.p1 TRINITY_DN1421_c0_g1~~TRINITY_DN1421_c0_g1_i1.p1  ORF type:complete len:246 (-),score=45.97 TRINITY_DN1421_c0_g1_i1:398-1102(-)
MRREGSKRGSGCSCIKDGQLSHSRKTPLTTNSTIKNCPMCKSQFLDSMRSCRSRKPSISKDSSPRHIPTNQEQQKDVTKNQNQKMRAVYRKYVNDFGEHGGYNSSPHNSSDKKDWWREGVTKHDYFWDQYDLDLALKNSVSSREFARFQNCEDEDDIQSVFFDEGDEEFSHLVFDQKIPLSCFFNEQDKCSDEKNEAEKQEFVQLLELTDQDSWENVSANAQDSESSFEIIQTY